MPKKKPPPQVFARRNEIYRFDLWSDGEWHTLTHTVDFQTPLENFRTGVCGWARRHKVRIETKKLKAIAGKHDRIAIRITPF